MAIPAVTLERTRVAGVFAVRTALSGRAAITLAIQQLLSSTHDGCASKIELRRGRKSRATIYARITL